MYKSLVIRLIKLLLIRDFFQKVVIFQVLLFFKAIHLNAMKALRIKTFNDDLHVSRFEIVLMKDIIDVNVSFLPSENVASIQLKLLQDRQLLLSLSCDDLQFEHFNIRWNKFLTNDDFYFDLSEWEH
jgi:hypothetical protein